jgi:hypothetical protein
LRLLEHGCLIAAKLVDDMNVSSSQKKGRLEDEEDEGPAETFEAFEQRLNTFVAIYLTSASSSKRDDYKESQVYQERKAVIHDFLKTTVSKKCQNPNCGA